MRTDFSLTDKKRLYLPVEISHKGWLIIFAALSECITYCFAPNWKFFDIRIGATFLNLFGAFLEGCATSYEKWEDNLLLNKISIAFRSSFLGVFTSFTFMVMHAGELMRINILMGFGYIFISLFLSFLAFFSGYRLVNTLLMHSPRTTYYSTEDPEGLSIKIFIAVCVLLFPLILYALIASPGTIRDPRDPQYHQVNYFNINGSIELLLGIIFSIMGIFCSNYLTNGDYNLIHWGIWKSNFISCLLVSILYALSFYFESITISIFWTKFISSFCSALSSFSSVIEIVMVSWIRGNIDKAILDLAANLLITFIFLQYAHF